MPGSQLDGHRVIFKRAKWAIRLNDGPPILTVILRDGCTSTRAHHDIEIRHRRLGNRKDAITGTSPSIERRRQRCAAFNDLAFERLFRHAPHAIRWTTKHRQSRQIRDQRPFETKIAVTADPRTSHANGQRQTWLIQRNRTATPGARNERRRLDKRRRKQGLGRGRRGPRRSGIFTGLFPRTYLFFATHERPREQSEQDKRIHLPSRMSGRIR